MSRRRSAWVLGCCTLACNDPSVDASADAFERDCDGDGLLELLTLADGEVVVAADRVGDGDVHVLVPAVDPDPAEGATWRLDAVIDRCGTERTEVVSHATALRWWGEVLVGCIDQDLVQLRGYDDPTPSLLARRGCTARQAGEWTVTFDGDAGGHEGRMLALRPVGPELEVRVLLDDWWVDDPEDSPWPTIEGGRMFAQDPALSLRSVDVSTGEIRVELDEVAAGRWRVQGDVIVHRPVPLDPAGTDPLRIWDRVTGRERILDAGVPNDWFFGFWSGGVLSAYPDVLLPLTDQRWFWLDSLQEVVPPEGTAIVDVRGDGLVWLSRIDPQTFQVELLRWRAPAAPEVAMSCAHCWVRWTGPDHIEVLVMLPTDHQLELWRAADADEPAVMVASGLGSALDWLTDGRVLTVPTSDLPRGPLLLFPGDGGPAIKLSERVTKDSIFLTSRYDRPDDDVDDIVFVTEPDEGPARLYRARLAP